MPEVIQVHIHGVTGIKAWDGGITPCTPCARHYGCGMAIAARALGGVLRIVPGFVLRRLGRRYVAGDDVGQALGTVAKLAAQGAAVTVDVLGEDVRSEGEALEAVREYEGLVDRLTAIGADATLSIKPSLMGLGLGEQMAERALDRVFERAARSGILVQIDMEDRTATDATIRLYRTMRSRWGNAGAVLQASLRRTMDDAREIGAEPGAVVRLCKGIYVEPAEHQIHDRAGVRESFTAILAALLEAGAFVGVATHDGALVDRAISIVRQMGIPGDRWEFQMLLGVRPELRRSLVARGFKVRVYVPYGRSWERYSARRLGENPRIAMHVIRSLLERDDR